MILNTLFPFFLSLSFLLFFISYVYSFLDILFFLTLLDPALQLKKNFLVFIHDILQL